MGMTAVEGKPFKMPSDNEQGPRCIFKDATGAVCGTILQTVYRTLHKDRFTFREHICPKCGRKNTTLQHTIERLE